MNRPATYEEDKAAINKFLSEFVLDDGVTPKYMRTLQKLANRESNVLQIDLDDLAKFDARFASKVAHNTLRYIGLFGDVVDSLNIAPTVEISDETVLDTYIRHRKILTENAQNGDQPTDTQVRYPPSLQRRFEVVFHQESKEKEKSVLSVRKVRAEHVGKLVSVEGIVTRTTAVKPMISVATYACDQCGRELYEEIRSPTFIPRELCVSDDCVKNKRSGRLQLINRGSKFEKFQELRIQELARDVPTGHIPRSMTVFAYGESTRKALPGDQVTVCGIFLPTPYTGFKQIRVGLLADTYLHAQTISKAKQSYSDQALTEMDRAEIEEQAQEPDIYERLAGSIAPQIYGHDDVKKALLLLLVGGVDRQMIDGMKIRGDINICLMGDPGVAKSQMLKAISDLAPRGIYTTGRGSSGVGLTAAVTKDPFTNEMLLEGGALVLADMGVCCIDEFDKMEESDRTAIHEVMEQQTISIAKAGIATTLNARASILAAANPLYGRYNPKKSAMQNINLPAALLSRFDLIFLMLDRPNMEADLRLAHHITYVHTHTDFPPLEHDPVTRDFMRNYISVARTHSPFIPEDLCTYIANAYVQMREDANADTETMTFTSARTLLAILRISTALARLRFSNQVVQDDIDEAIRLMFMSKATLVDARQEKTRSKNPLDEIFKIIREMVEASSTGRIDVEDARRRCTSKGYKPSQFEACLDEYQDLNVWQLNAARTRLAFV
eukprot:m.277313 g.277313  ORF g.277313 m.277313 type:complete len:724 (+) comp54871_c0_seq1:68-2239(+)